MKLKGFVKYKSPNSDKVESLRGYWEKVDHLKGSRNSDFVVSNFDGSEYYVFSKDDSILSDNVETCYRNQDEEAYLDFGSYMDQLERIITRINLKEFQKIIFSRRELIGNKINPELLFKALNIEYDNSFNYLLGIEGVGVWLGATPEVFLKAEESKFKMHSLAGTLPKNEEKNYQWTTKEKEEQKIVTDYILGHLEKSGIMDVTLKGPYNFEHGSVVHLKTDFSVSATDDQINELLREVHPTPAVCGIPKERVLNKIQEIEGYNRRFYTGLVGVYSKDDTQLYVNLRCMEVFLNDASLYLGGGITSGSNPENEWDETVLKSKTLMNLI